MINHNQIITNVSTRLPLRLRQKMELRDRGMNRMEIDQVLSSVTSSQRPMDDSAILDAASGGGSVELALPPTVLPGLTSHSEGMFCGVGAELDGLIESVLGSVRQVSESANRDAMRKTLLQRRRNEEARACEERDAPGKVGASASQGSFASFVQAKLAAQPEYAEVRRLFIYIQSYTALVEIRNILNWKNQQTLK